AAAFFAATVPGSFHAIQEVIARVLVLIEAGAIEYEEFELRAEERGVGDSRRLHVIDSLAGDISGVATVVLAGGRGLNAANKDKGGLFEEGINEGGFWLRDHKHVGFIDRLPAAYAGAVEAQAVLERRFFQVVRRDGEVLPRPGEIDEPQVNRFDFFFT